MSIYKLSAVLGLFFIFCIIYSCNQNRDEGTGTSQSGDISQTHKFVGGQACQSCHEKEWEDWKGSHHDYAIAEADSASVRADFNNSQFTKEDGTYRFFRDEEKYMVEAPGPDGNPEIFEITYTFGWTPLQQYLVDFGKGKLQALQVAWDTEQEEWFDLQPNENVEAGDWLHWTGGAMNWNTMCADCHSTNLKQNYIASADSFHTTWSSLDVSCESCHGQGRDHVELMKSEEGSRATIDRIRQDLQLTKGVSQTDQINQCAQCHSLRQELTDDYRHEGDFLDHYSPTLPHPDLYFADGQIREEVYVYGSFLQSKMYKQGVQCTDCHSPHTLKLKANVENNTLCMNCHEPVYNTPGHHFHKMNTEASKCISCHMPGRYYMEIDFRRDHSFRVPRPDLSSEYNTPNACNGCHDQQTAEWAAEAVEQWYGPDRLEHFSEILARADSVGPEAAGELEQLAADTVHPDIARAIAIWYLGQFPGQQSTEQLTRALQDESPLVRISAARAMANFPAEVKLNLLADGLEDSIQSVRLAAAWGLAEFSASDMVDGLKQPFRQAILEYRKQLAVNRYFPQGLMNLGQFYEKQGQPEEAITAYGEALEKDPKFNPARINLAYLYNARGDNERARQLLQTVIDQEPGYGPAHYSMGLLLAEENRLEEAIAYFEDAAKSMPEAARVRYNWAVALQTIGRPEQAEKIYQQAIELAPQHPDYLYGICTLYIQQNQYREALPYAQRLLELRPNDPNIQNLVRIIEYRLE